MAKKKAVKKTTNKSQAIRDFASAHPSAKPREIAEGLKKSGLEVKAQFISNVLSKAKQATPKNTKVSKVRRASKPSSGNLSVESLLTMKKAIDQVGGLDEAKAAIDAIDKLSD